MHIKRKRTNKKPSWLRRFWEWFSYPFRGEDDIEAETPLPEKPKALPPKADTWQPQGKIYKMLDSRSRLIAGNGSSRAADLQVYDYCGVVFYKADQVYHYINPGIELHVGDRVEAPVHIHGKTEMAVGLVVSSGEYLAECVPYPISQSSIIVRKL